MGEKDEEKQAKEGRKYYGTTESGGAWRPARRIAKRPGRIENKRSKEGGVGEENEKEEGK